MEETNKCSVDDAMEVKEKGQQIQPPKRVKTKETVYSEEGEDRISLLPDSLIIDEILSRLETTKYAIRTGGCIYYYPTGRISWNNLKNLSITHGKLDENLIANILSGSPLLDTLRLVNCYGYSRIDITSKSVKNLELSGYHDPEEEYYFDIIEINAPYVLSLTIEGGLLLSELLLLDVSSLVKAYLKYTLVPYDMATREEEEVMLKGHLLHLRHVKELEIGIACYMVFSRLEEQGFVYPSNLWVPDVTPPLSNSSDIQLI